MPRVSVPVVEYGSDKLTLECGCITVLDPGTEAWKSSHKCAVHQTLAATDLEYYRRFGVIDDVGVPQSTNHVHELVENVGHLLRCDAAIGHLLEIGAGVSPYAPYFQELGYTYIGMDPSQAACEFMRKTYGVVMLQSSWEDPCPELEQALLRFDVVFAAHTLEHFCDAPVALEKMAEHIVPGGLLYLVVPEGTDQANPGHFWFFYEDSIRNAVVAAGLEVVTLSINQYADNERFIYVKARRPEPERDSWEVVLPVSYTGFEGLSWLSRRELRHLIQLVPNRGSFLEVGSASGVTGALVAKNRPEANVVCIDNFSECNSKDQSMISSVDCTAAERFVHWESNKQQNQSLFVGDLRQFADRNQLKFSVILVDGGHEEEECYDDLWESLPLLGDGGYLCCHDYRDPTWVGVAKAVDKFIAESHVEVVCITGSMIVMRRAGAV